LGENNEESKNEENIKDDIKEEQPLIIEEDAKTYEEKTSKFNVNNENTQVRTYNLINTDSNYFQFDDRDEKIKEIKNQLKELGFGTHWKNPTNYFGRDTEKVVREFQEYYGITVNGIMDEEFFSKLE